MTKYQKRARETYKVGDPIDDMWHPEVQAECEKMNEEAAAARSAIKTVVESVDKLEEEFKGCIAIRFGFKGSVREAQAVTKTEVDTLLSNLPQEERERVKKELKSTKRLFSKDGFQQWEDLKSERTKWANQLKNFGIPFVLDGMTVVRIEKIPDVEKLLDEIEQKHAEMVAKLIEAYPYAIEPGTVDSPLYDARDYPQAETLKARFKVIRQWAHFGVPDVLKEIDEKRWQAERARTAEMWREIKENGLIALRKMVADMTERLVEAVKPDEKTGERKRFYATAVTNLTDFFETFEDRNIAGDEELEAQVKKLKELVEGKDVEKFKTDEALRKQVQESGSKIADKLQSMVVAASTRVIRFED